MEYNHFATTRECIHNLFFPVGRHHLFTVRGLRLLVAPLFFILSPLKLFTYFYSYTITIVVCFFFFLTCTFFTYNAPSWVGIKIAIKLVQKNANFFRLQDWNKLN